MPTSQQYVKIPPFVDVSTAPLVMLVMGRDHKLYYEAYNDASDLNEDGVLDINYKPEEIDYYGYFDSYKYYVYSAANQRFEPAGETLDKKVPAGNNSYWSGDFLNYLTTSRMDAIRKVLYGGYRSTDTATETVLERAYIPQDAHSWGKEYESIARDGYDIREYAPLPLPAVTPAQTRHLFASTSLYPPTDTNYRPLLRVLNDSIFRVWEWVSIERPVAGSQCEDNTSRRACATSGSTAWQVVPNNATFGMSNVTQTVYSTIDSPTSPASPVNYAAYETLESTYGQPPATPIGSATANTINGTNNPFSEQQEDYLTIFTGTINVPALATYTFAIDGDDAVEFSIDTLGNGFDASDVVAHYYGAHAKIGNYSRTGTVTLNAGSYNFKYRHHNRGESSAYSLYWQIGAPASAITDYTVRVKVGDPTMPEANCKAYPNGTYKPVGLLQRHGETDSMYFGLISGSYTRNLSGGVLRKNISSIRDEINLDTGQFTNVNGIIGSINKFRISRFRYSDHAYEPGWSGAWVTTRPMNEGEFPDWGNPIAEMMFESLRYFGGEGAPTPAFHSASMARDDALGLPNVAWQDPYQTFPECAKPFMLVISDIYPSYDSDQLPGSPFGTMAAAAIGAAADPLNVQTIGNLISTVEGNTGDRFIGQVGATYDGACTPKTVGGLGNIRGLCPEEPTKQGSYYSAAVAYYGRTQDLSATISDQKVYTYTVALASPLPNIEIPIQNQIVRLVPFAKSVAGLSINRNAGNFQPTNTIVDFYVEEIQPHFGRFRINFEDVEQGADHDMDAIVLYQYQLVDSDGNPVTADTIDQAVAVDISLTSEYARGSIVQHIGYIISGTSKDGTYLEVRDVPEPSGGDPDVDYFLDTPPGVWADTGGTAWQNNTALPLTTSRRFSVDPNGGTTSASLLPNPLWYAAKWGGFEETRQNATGLPDDPQKWDRAGDGVPDTYFYVANPLKLEEQLNRSFADILARTASGTAASVVSSSRSGEGAIYQSVFYPVLSDKDLNSMTWAGQVHALMVDAYGNMREDTTGDKRLDLANDLFIIFDGDTIRKYKDVNANGIFDEDDLAAGPVTNPNTGSMNHTLTEVNLLWSSSDWLNTLADPVSQRTYGSTNAQRYIFTFVDASGNMVPGSGEIKNFVAPSDPSWSQMTDPDDFFAYLHTYEPFNPPIDPADSDFQNMVRRQARRIVNYIRGQDQLEDTVGSVTLNAFRSRQLDYNDDGTVNTWRLGDIVHSTPTLVAQPAEDFDLIYRDKGYSDFYRRYQFRRNVIYTGANDGMIHAFNAGFYDITNQQYLLSPVDRSGNPLTTGGPYPAFPLGAEMWAYVPYNLLSHLYWLTQPDYEHIYYVDMPPRVFDARIYKDKGPTDPDNPNGWATVLVMGMRFGGGKIAADIVKGTGPYDPDVDKAMSSAFVIFDITNPEKPPKLLGEVTFPELGFTTCHPGVIPMRDFQQNFTEGTNQWYLVFGSGPASPDADGVPGANPQALNDGTSSQQAVMYAMDLVSLASDGKVVMVTSEGKKDYIPGSDTNYLVRFSEENSSVSKPIAVDWDLDFNTDAIYFGTSFGDHVNGWGGKLRRIVMDNGSDPTNPSNWTTDNTLINLSASTVWPNLPNGQPIMASATAGTDKYKNRWIYFGTGRFYGQKDKENLDQQSYYGIKEPFTVDSNDNVTKIFDYSTVALSELEDVTNVKVYQYGDSINGFDDFTAMDNYIEENRQGWRLNFTTGAGARNLGEAVLAGDILTFTTYTPSDDPCVPEGYSHAYGLYYRTGTAYFKSVFGLDYGDMSEGEPLVLKVASLGQGMTITPNIHIGRQEGSRAYIQSSTGAIQSLEQANPGIIKSGKMPWKPDTQTCP